MEEKRRLPDCDKVFEETLAGIDEARVWEGIKWSTKANFVAR
jgi:hypothetical protein